MPRSVTAYTLTLNEARQIRAVLESLKWADEVIVVDSFSTDDTVPLAQGYGARIIQEKFIGFGPLRNVALAAAKHDWVFSLDADERCTAELAAEVRQELAAPRYEAYHVPRKSHFLGHWMRHSGWYPDYRQPQLFTRRAFRYNEEVVHESYTLKGRLGYLREHVLQYPWDTLEIATAKLQRYSTLMAQRYLEAGRRASVGKMLLSPAGMFFKVFVAQQGFRDGRYGFVLATLYAYYTFLKYAKVWNNSVEPMEVSRLEPPLMTSHNAKNGRVRLLLFDIDGTLIRSGGAGVRAFAKVFATEFNAANGIERLNFAGRTDLSLLREFFGFHQIAPTSENFERFFDRYVFWLDHLLQESRATVCPGVLEFIAGARALPQPPLLGLLTGNIQLGAEIKLRHLGLWDLFVTGGFADDHEDRGQIAAIARSRASRILGEERREGEVLVIGDTPHDIRCARAIQARVLAVATGGHPLEELQAHQPDWAVADLRQVTAREVSAGR